MKSEINRSIYVYVSRSELYGRLPVFWMDCQKNKEALKQELIRGYDMKDQALVNDVVSIVSETYEKQDIEMKELGCASEEHTVDDWVRDELYHSMLQYRIKEESGHYSDESLSEESIYDYVTERDLWGVLPIRWIEVGKSKEALKKELIDEYGMSDVTLIEEAMTEVIQTYEYAASDVEGRGEGCGERTLDEWLVDEFLEWQGEYDLSVEYSKRSSGIFFSVREADGEYVLNTGGCLSVIGVIFLIIILGGVFAS